mmetsp:Transcript_93428/g.237838  ORF Transcript_93428/g.237838 Transcript_93428/m.237838 type:complete len:216 (+) Transcript_93428:729-1376(+)
MLDGKFPPLIEVRVRCLKLLPLRLIQLAALCHLFDAVDAGRHCEGQLVEEVLEILLGILHGVEPPSERAVPEVEAEELGFHGNQIAPAQADTLRVQGSGATQGVLSQLAEHEYDAFHICIVGYQRPKMRPGEHPARLQKLPQGSALDKCFRNLVGVKAREPSFVRKSLLMPLQNQPHLHKRLVGLNQRTILQGEGRLGIQQVEVLTQREAGVLFG